LVKLCIPFSYVGILFYAAGFTTKLVPNFADFLLKKINTLILPFLAVNLFFIIFRYLCNNFQAEIFWKLVPEYNFIQNLNPLLYLSSTENIGGATWFLVALFFSHLCFQKVLVFVEKIKYKNYFWLVFIPALGFIGMVAKLQPNKDQLYVRYHSYGASFYSDGLCCAD
jgi:fucose 4-O-acetylase-like acetyltransferase